MIHFVGQAQVCPTFQFESAKAIEVTNTTQFLNALESIKPGQTLLLQTGIYKIPSTIHITTPNITIRSKTGKKEDVVLDGNTGGLPLSREKFIPEVVLIQASQVNLAHITIRNGRDHGVHISPQWEGGSLKNISLHDIRVTDCGQQLIKVNPNGNPSNLQWVDSSSLVCSVLDFENNSVMDNQGSYFYTGGLDAHAASGWVVRYNTFKNIQRDNTLMEHAVHFWSKSRANLIENNIFINVYRGIGLGMKTEPTTAERKYSDNLGNSPYLDHLEGIVRNNLIYNASNVHLESGIELSNVLNTQVYHNTIVSGSEPFSSIEYRWPNTKIILKNNLVSHSIKQRNNAFAELGGNVENAPLAAFKNPLSGDFHLSLSGQAIAQTNIKLPLNLFGYDIDGEVYGQTIYAGADQPNGITFLTPRKWNHFSKQPKKIKSSLRQTPRLQVIFDQNTKPYALDGANLLTIQ